MGFFGYSFLRYQRYKLFKKYLIQHCFIGRPSDSTVWEYAGMESRTVATLALTIRCFNQSASRFHIRLDFIHGRLDLIHTRLDLIQGRLIPKNSVKSHPHLSISYPHPALCRSHPQLNSLLHSLLVLGFFRTIGQNLKAALLESAAFWS
jgi:hypothetical protein